MIRWAPICLLLTGCSNYGLTAEDPVAIAVARRGTDGADYVQMAQVWGSDGVNTTHSKSVRVDAAGQSADAQSLVLLAADCSDTPAGEDLCFPLNPAGIALPDGSTITFESGAKRTDPDGAVRWSNTNVIDALDAVRGPWLLMRGHGSAVSLDIDTGHPRWTYSLPGQI
jgi:hypothetical protein